ncbi:hypothetical protein BDR03DRAFT_964391 [Suillus americanus]|nr:hypothetical protein BDR03DRAFT_964391 [Suillus americanus]
MLCFVRLVPFDASCRVAACPVSFCSLLLWRLLIRGESVQYLRLTLCASHITPCVHFSIIFRPFSRIFIPFLIL